jgi:hypothetical protein
MTREDSDTAFAITSLALFALGVALFEGSSFKITGAFLATFFGALSYLYYIRGPRR